MPQSESNLQDIITQLVSFNLYLLKVLGTEDLTKAQSIIVYAIEHCRRNDKIESKLLIETYKIAFPDKPLPKIISEEEAKEIFKRQQSDNT